MVSWSAYIGYQMNIFPSHHRRQINCKHFGELNALQLPKNIANVNIILNSALKESIKVIIESKGQKQPPEVFCKKGVLKNFAKFTVKQLCQSLLLIRVVALIMNLWIQYLPHTFYPPEHLILSIKKTRRLKASMFRLHSHEPNARNVNSCIIDEKIKIW